MISSKKARDYQDDESDADSYGSLLTTVTNMTQVTLEDDTLNELATSYQYPSYAESVIGGSLNSTDSTMDQTHISSPTTSTNSEWQREKQELEEQIKRQAEQIEKIQADLEAKISRSQDLEDKLAKAIELAHFRDTRHDEMMEKFEQLMRQQEQQLVAHENKQPATPNRNKQVSESPPTKKANTNASPSRHIYAMFRPQPARQIMGKQMQTTKPSPRGKAIQETIPAQTMDIDDNISPPPPVVRPGKKLE
jgi:hypothetical protein